MMGHMKRLSRASIVSFMMSLVVACAAGADPAPRPRVVGYAPTWVDLKALVPTIDFARLTHVSVAFVNPADDAGTLPFPEPVRGLIAAAHKADVKVLISVGGGAAASDQRLLGRYAKLTAADRRAGFVEKLVAYVVDHGFDGLDLDLEGPAITKEYGPLVEALSDALRAKGKLLTAALSQGYGGASVPDAALARFDFVNVMAYDARGPWNPKAAGQHAPTDGAKAQVAYWLGRGLARDKCVLGVPFYGYGFGPAFRRQAYGYAEIVAAHAGAEQTDQAGETIWYNGVPTIRAKARYAVDEKLGGVMIWSLDLDAAGEKSLLRAIGEEVGKR
jgi:GH18 family chitinase